MDMYSPEVLISENQIKTRIKELANAITRDFANDELVVICVLKGAFMFCSDLVKEINLPIRVEFISLSSYGDDTKTSGEVSLDMDITGSVEDKNILVVEDIVDTGTTMKFLLKHLENKGAKNVKVASLLFKPTRNEHPVDIHYLAFEVDDKFVIGYGLDYAGRYRELPYIGILNAGH